jgi:small subunit ribosomal protein S2e
MADRGGGERGAFGRGFGGRGGDRGRGRGRGDRGRGRGKDKEEEKWVPCTKLGRLVQQVRPGARSQVAASLLSRATVPAHTWPASSRGLGARVTCACLVAAQGKIKSLEQVYLFSMPVKEYQIVEELLGKGTLKDEVMKIMPVQKQTRAGQRTRFKVRSSRLLWQL